jgi:hypothetical protein
VKRIPDVGSGREKLAVGEKYEEPDCKRDKEVKKLLTIVGSQLEKTVEHIFSFTIGDRKYAEDADGNKHHIQPDHEPVNTL